MIRIINVNIHEEKKGGEYYSKKKKAKQSKAKQNIYICVRMCGILRMEDCMCVLDTNIRSNIYFAWNIVCVMAERTESMGPFPKIASRSRIVNSPMIGTHLIYTHMKINEQQQGHRGKKGGGINQHEKVLALFLIYK